MEILQARILEWVAMPSSRGSSQPQTQTQISRIAGRWFTILATREVAQYKKVTTIIRITLGLHGIWNQNHKSKRIRAIKKREQEKD